MLAVDGTNLHLRLFFFKAAFLLIQDVITEVTCWDDQTSLDSLIDLPICLDNRLQTQRVGLAEKVTTQVNND